MLRPLAAALLLQGALADVAIRPIPGLPEVTAAPTQISLPGTNQLAHIVAAAASDEAGLRACATADIIISKCVTEVPNFTRAADSVIAACMCCTSASYIAPVYRSCASYISASASEYTRDYELATLASSLCRLGGGSSVCSNTATGLVSGSATGTSASATATDDDTSVGTRTSASSRRTTTSRPAGCTSFANIIASCSRADDDFFDQSGSKQASCICYDGSTYDTKFDDYATSCARWARTGLSTGYSDIADLTTFCSDHPGSKTKTSTTPTDSATDSTTTTSDDSIGGVGGQGGGSSPTSTTTVTPAPTAPPANPAPRSGADGLLVWASVLLGAVFTGLLLA